jgi:hypothetical protein
MIYRHVAEPPELHSQSIDWDFLERIILSPRRQGTPGPAHRWRSDAERNSACPTQQCLSWVSGFILGILLVKFKI